MNRKARIFYVGRIDRDVSMAKKFGEMTGVMQPGERDRRFSVFKPSDFCQQLLDELREKNYDPRCDFILLSGSIIHVSLLVGTVMSTWGEMNALLFDSTKGDYVQRDVSQPQPSEI